MGCPPIRTSIVVNEPGMHDDGARRQVCPQSYSRTGSDSHPFGDDIVHHWWEIIHTCEGGGVAVVGA